MDDYERVLLVKPDVHVYKIPPRVSNRAYRASDWNLDTPDWNCRLRLISKGDDCYIKLDEKSTGQFFGKCPIDKYPGTAVEPVSDSSRYFVLRLLNEQTGRTAFVGIGFVDRSDSFDLNVALQDHFKSLDLENKLGDNNIEDNAPKLDLKFKEGQTIKVNLNIGNKSCSKPRPKPMSAGNKGMTSGILLPPPPGNTNKSSNRENIASPDLFDHSESTQQQKVLDNLESLNISNDLSLLKSSDNDGDDNAKLKTSVPTSTAEDTSNIDWVDFKSSSSTIGTTSNIALLNDNDNSPFSSNNTNTKPSDSGSVEGDLWSDFTSCNNNSSNTTTTTTTTKTTTNTPDDWAKFF